MRNVSLFSILVVIVISIQSSEAGVKRTTKISDVSLRKTLGQTTTINDRVVTKLTKRFGTKSSRTGKYLQNVQETIPRGGQVVNTLPKALMGSVIMALIEKLVKEGLAAAKIKFPAGLGACIGLFFFLISLDFISPSTSAAIFDTLTPGAALLTKWLPVMFVPGLVCLPLSPPIGGPSEVSFFFFYSTFSLVHELIRNIILKIYIVYPFFIISLCQLKNIYDS
jgi:hypothetical protein